MKKRIDNGSDGEGDDSQDVTKEKNISSMYDDSVDVVGADDVLSPPSSATEQNVIAKESLGDHLSADRDTRIQSINNSSWSKKGPEPINRLSDNSENSEDDEDDDDDDDDDDDIRGPVIHEGYDPSEYEQLAVSEEIKDVFNYITKYTPQNIELENKLWPFLPDFIPAVGDVDAFIKVSRPDGKNDGLGLKVLDEPSLQQSDPAVLQLQLRAVAKQSSAKAVVVKKIENAEKNSKAIKSWIKAINDLHSTKPSQTVQFTKPMPNIDNLMQEWPQEFEEKLNSVLAPNPDLDCDLSTYVTIICNLFDIPVYDSKIQPLHTFFTLYSTMKKTQEQLNQSQNRKIGESTAEE